MTVAEFIAKWRKVGLKERSAAQERFVDLCDVFGHPTPATADPTGESFCFEKGAVKHGGGDGFADVWKRQFWGWEYKGRHKNLAEAYDRLLRYRDSLESPPLLIVCDLDRIVIHTNFTGTGSATYDIPLEALAEPRNVEVMRAVFHNPEALRPGRTSAAVTQDAARHFAEIAAAMRQRGLDPAAVAHFLDRVVFCLFAEDTGLLPDSLFGRIVTQSAGDPVRFRKILGQLFDTMATGGDFGLEPIRHFDGNLFDDRTVLDLTDDEVKRISAATTLDWSAVDPSIFGTLFERGLDPDTRAQLGAHFTSREDIELVVDAVIMTVLRREWDECRQTIERLLATGRKTATVSAVPAKPLTAATRKKVRSEAESILHNFLVRLRSVKILDPACGSGNFLYVALLRLKDLEKEVAVDFPGKHGLNSFLPGISPSQLYGIEKNAYAHDLAQMTVWIGWLQWIRANGFGCPDDPILRPLTGNIRLMDAILADHGEPEWPAVDFITGNPPFLGGKFLRRELKDAEVDRLFALWRDRVPPEADLCCYWFEKARAHIAAGKCKRAGLLATQGIRGGASREVLERIKGSGDIFWAESYRPWLLDGANVRVSMVAFDDGTEITRTLDGKPVPTINANLTASADITRSARLPANQDICFMGTTKGGAFDISQEQALSWLHLPNPHGRPSSDVLVPWVNGMDLNQRSSNTWIIDYGVAMTEGEAAKYEAVFGHVLTNVRPQREKSRSTIAEWWLHERRREDMRAAIQPLARFLCTCRVSKHRLFVWLRAPTLPDCATFAFARSDDYFFGVLHSRLHEVWALGLGTRLETRPRYTPTTCFDTFPFPAARGERDAAIAAAARELNELRNRWLNPPEWTKEEILEFPGTVGGPWDRHIVNPRLPPTGDMEVGEVQDSTAWEFAMAEHAVELARQDATARRPVRPGEVGLVRYPRMVPRDAESANLLAKRTLTNLYNQRPAWLDNAHRQLDAAVFAAYGWDPAMTDEKVLESLLALNLERAGQPTG